MRLLSAAILLLSLPVFLSYASPAYPTSGRRSVHEQRTDILQRRYKRQFRAENDLVIPLRIALKQQNTDRIEDLLNEVAHPDSPKYGQHYTPAEVAKLFAPSEETVSTVKSWLNNHGILSDRISTSANGGWLGIKLAIHEAEKLLDTSFHVYGHDDGSQHIGCDKYSLPDHVIPHIDFVTPTVNAPARRSFEQHQSLKKRTLSKRKIDKSLLRGPINTGKKISKQAPSDLSTCGQFITPDCLRALYNINRTPTETRRNSFQILELTPQSFVQADLDMFFANFSKHQVQRTPSIVLMDGATVTSNETTSFDINGESDLDLEYGMVLVNPQPVQLLQVGDDVEGASFNNMLDGLDKSFCTFEGGDDPNFDGIYPDPLDGGFKGPESCGIATPAHVISVSYGSDEVFFTPFYQIRECQEHAKLGLIGTTVLYAAGDDGVAGGGGLCIEKLPDGTVTESLNGTTFSPSFPEGCPFVVGVGATQIDPNNTVNDPESAAMDLRNGFFSGGGFSNVFATPQYQKATIAEFYKNFPPPYGADIYNNSQKVRGYPDVSANGLAYLIALDGEFALVDGTSASTPTFASVLTLINDARLAAGKSPVGFIQPAIYSSAFKGAFNDITKGNNPGCGTNGFSAVPGWDPVTGLGTPNFPKLLEAFLKLP